MLCDMEGPAGVKEMYFWITKEANEYFMVFSAAFGNINHACGHIDEFLDRHRLNSYAFEVKLGAREILNNAVKHGSQNNPDKNIWFKIASRPDRLILQARDEGDGFAPFQPLPGNGEALNESGRGLEILHSYFDRVSFSPKGNEITLEMHVFGNAE